MLREVRERRERMEGGRNRMTFSLKSSSVSCSNVKIDCRDREVERRINCVRGGDERERHTRPVHAPSWHPVHYS
jgi:hypothetical protein